MPELLTDDEKMTLLEAMRRRLKEYACAEEPDARPPTFLALCYAFDIDPASYELTVSQDSEFGAQVAEKERHLKLMMGGIAMGRTAASGTASEALRLAERLEPETFGVKKALPQGQVVALISSLSDEEAAKKTALLLEALRDVAAESEAIDAEVDRYLE